MKCKMEALNSIMFLSAIIKTAKNRYYMILIFLLMREKPSVLSAEPEVPSPVW